jgi:hypothetical protein
MKGLEPISCRGVLLYTSFTQFGQFGITEHQLLEIIL